MSIDSAEKQDAKLLRSLRDRDSIADFLNDRWGGAEAAEILDEFVNDAKEAEANAINDEGLPAQVTFLFDKLGAARLTRELAEGLYG